MRSKPMALSVSWFKINNGKVREKTGLVVGRDSISIKQYPA